MHTASSARRTCSASWSAVEKTATLASPSSRHARIALSAISPRFATRTLSTFGLAELDDVLACVHEILVLDQKPRDAALGVALHLVEALHDLDETDNVARLDLVAFVHVRVGRRVRPPVERPRQRGLDRLRHQAASTLALVRLSSRARSASIASSSEASRKRTVSPTGLNWPIFQKSAWITVAATMKPPAVGPSGPRMTGRSPLTLIAPTG